jgi:hypothetical protein
MVANFCNLSTWEAEAGRSGVQGQFELHSKFQASLKQTRKQRNEWRG